MLETFISYQEGYSDEQEKSQIPKLTKTQQDELVHNAVAEWIEFSTEYQNRFIQSDENWQHYLENVPAGVDLASTDEYESHANIRRGEIVKAVDGVHAQQHLATFPGEEQFFEGESKNGVAKQWLPAYEKLLSTNIEDINFLIKAYNVEKNRIMDGVSAVWMPFTRLVKNKAVYSWPVLNDVTLEVGGLTKNKVEKIEYEATDSIPLRFTEWRIDPTIEDLANTPFLWRRWVLPEEIKAVDIFENTEDIAAFKDVYEDTNWAQNKFIYNGINYTSHMMGNESTARSRYACLMERWGDFYIDGKLYRNMVLVWCNDKTFLYFGPNPYDHDEKPFAVIPYNPVPGSLLGQTSVTAAIPSANALDTMVNQVLDILSSAANGASLVNVQDKALMEWFKPGKTIGQGELIPSSNINDAIKNLDGNLDGLATIIPLTQTLIENIRDLTGGVPYATGDSSNTQDRTLGEVEILSSSTNTKYQTIIQIYEKYHLKPYIRQSFENHRQFMSQAVHVPGFDEPLTPEIVKQMEVVFTITGSRSVLMKGQEKQNLTTLMLQILPPLFQAHLATPTAETMEINIPNLFKRFLSLSNVDVDSTVKTVSMQQGAPQQDITNPNALAQAAQVAQQGGQNELPAVQQPGPPGQNPYMGNA